MCCAGKEKNIHICFLFLFLFLFFFFFVLFFLVMISCILGFDFQLKVFFSFSYFVLYWIQPELIREVDLGPFKHKVDDGLELRKASFEVMYTLLGTCIDRLDLQEFIMQMAHGLKDQYDIKTLNHLMLSRLATRSGASLVAGLELNFITFFIVFVVEFLAGRDKKKKKSLDQNI